DQISSSLDERSGTDHDFVCRAADKGGGAKRRGVSVLKNENPPLAFGSRPPYQGVGMTYVNDRFYEELVASFSDWQRPELEVADVATRDECRRLLEREARLLDEGRYEDWLALYADECVVWVREAERPGDARCEVTGVFDARQRLQVRILRRQPGTAGSA